MSSYCRTKKSWAWPVDPDALRMLSHAVALAPRLLVHVASIAALAGLVNACVPATRYEQVKSAGEVELAARQRAERSLQATREQLDALSAELDQQKQQLAETEQSVSETKLENTVATKERDEATGLVAQLRGDLARVGDNLRSYAQEKADLERSLQMATACQLDLQKNDAHTIAIARLMRDLSAGFGERVIAADVSLDVQDGHVIVSAPFDFWFDDRSVLRPGTKGVLATLSRVIAARSGRAATVRVNGPAADERGAVLLAALEAAGASASQLTLESPRPELTTPGGSSVPPTALTIGGLTPPASAAIAFSVSTG